MGRIFGTDGVRGVAGRELDITLAMNIGRATAMVVKRKSTKQKPIIAIGKDTRISSDMLEMAVIAGICSVGADVLCLGVVPTPAVAHLVITEDCDAGIMLSASHNSFEYNGIKLFGAKGHKLNDAEEEEIEAIILDGIEEYYVATHSEIGRVTSTDCAAEAYISYISSLANGEFKEYRVLIDCSNGSASATAEDIFKRIGLKFDMLAATPDGVNINNKCGSTHIERLGKQVVAGGYHMGFAFDGDADRFLAVDEKGRVLDGDRIVAICSDYLKAEGKLNKDTVVVTSMSNMGFMLLMKSRNVDVKTTKVGDRYVLEEMRNGGFSIGGEQSGHIIFSDYSTTGDGQLSAIMLLNAIKKAGHKLSVLYDTMVTFPQTLVNVAANNDMKAKLNTNEELKVIIAECEKALEGRGRVLIRVSGTEPVIRVMVEGQNEGEISTIADKIAAAISTLLA